MGVGFSPRSFSRIINISMAIVDKTVLLDVTMDIPDVQTVEVITTSTLIPPPLVAVTGVVPTLIPTGAELGAGSTMTAVPSAPAPVVVVTFSGAWPQENFPLFSYRYIVLPSTQIITVHTLEEVPVGATIVGYSADPTLFKVNTWTLSYIDGGVPGTAPVSQKVWNNFSRQSLKLKARLESDASTNP
jgi:hypothetical protein